MSENEPIKVLLLSDSFQVRGSSSYTLCLAEHLSAYGVQATVICDNASAITEELRRKLNIIAVPAFKFPVWGRLVLQGLKSELEVDPPQLIHIQNRAVLPAGVVLARQLEVPFILTVHDYLQPRDRFRFDQQWGRRIIAVSDSVKSELQSRVNIPDPLVQVIHSGIDVSHGMPEREVLQPGRIPVIGMAGPLEESKGAMYFLDAARLVLDRGHRVEFLIAGGGPEEFRLRRQVSDLGIGEHVTFASNLYDFSTPIAAMDIFCLPALQQGLGTVMFQAMAFGRPVIATAAGGVHSVVCDGENALVVPPRDSRSLADRMQQLLTDPDRARELGAAGERMIREQYSADAMLGATTTLYREIIRDHAETLAVPETA